MMNSETITESIDNNNENDPLVDCNGPKVYLMISSDDDHKIITQDNETDNNNVQNSTSIDTIELQWQNLIYEIIVKSSKLKNNNDNDTKCSTNQQHYYDNRRRRLLQSLNGTIRTGEITALIGPSGSGKTTLLECISGRNKQFNMGQVNVCTSIEQSQKSIESIRLAYLSHTDTMMMILTVKETLLFASKLMITSNSNFNNCDLNPFLEANRITTNLIQKLGLDSCKNIYVGRCSNGQQKRVSIALELLFSPTILLLDEPTSGLDSIACINTIQLLRELADDYRQPIAIMLSIHQPTATMLKYFNNLYVMSMNGYCLYHGPSNQIVDYLAEFQINCPKYHNPADFITEIAIGNQCDTNQMELLISATASHQQQQQPQESSKRIIPIRKIIQQSRSNGKSGIVQLYHLWLRSIMLQYRNPSELLIRIFGTGIVIFIIAFIYKDMRLGENDSCYRPIIRNMIRDQIKNNQTMLLKDFEWSKQMLEESRNQFNYAFLFFIEMFIAFISTLPVLLTFPMEIIVIRRELSHGWYGLPIYFIAKNMVTILPSLIISILFGTTIYFLTDQPLDEQWRFVYFNIILMLMALVGDGVGQLISSLFVKHANQALIVAAISQMGLILFSGLFVPNSSLPIPLKQMTYVSQYRLGFESLIINIYGFDRCRIINDNNDNDNEFLTNEALIIKLIRKQFSNDTIVSWKKCVKNQLMDDEQGKFYTIYNEIFDSFDMIIGRPMETFSIAKRSFNLDDNQLYFNIKMLILYIFIYRILAYIVLYRKVRY
ncbi:ATP-binding cassette sub-family G member 1-like [Dermatophagoides pteronyssinus]|uniref:ATP-binding cassette sub-family G member 1-like n=1 Tax=Dermatophagoides pteronyssinus TaxID=6956 RepID=UPI003F67394D